jgi:hypothetical protein
MQSSLIQRARPPPRFPSPVALNSCVCLDHSALLDLTICICRYARATNGTDDRSSLMTRILCCSSATADTSRITASHPPRLTAQSEYELHHQAPWQYTVRKLPSRIHDYLHPQIAHILTAIRDAASDRCSRHRNQPESELARLQYPVHRFWWSAIRKLRQICELVRP